MAEIIDRFDGKYFFLSNFYICDVEYDGIVYPHTEAAFHAQKVFDDETKMKFTDVDPRQSKRLGHKVKLRKDWAEVKDNVMYEICKAKFEQNEDIRKLLLETGDAILIEGNTWNDQYWGVSNGKGRNQLGKTLMRIRDELREVNDLKDAHMIELNNKIVLHIPLYKFADEELAPIDIDEILDDLLSQFSQNGYDSLYITHVDAYYKSRNFDELLLTIFTSSNQNNQSPETIFKKWFRENNDILGQEAFAYELNNSLFVEEIR